MPDLPDGVEMRDGKYVLVNVDGMPEVADADTLGKIVDALESALAVALDKWEQHSFRSRMIGGPGESIDRAQIAELRDKLLGGKRSPL